MPRANRNYLSGQVWHITHRCHQQEFLLKFSKDRSNFIKWLYEAKKRFGLCVFDYMVTSNHIHLLVKDTGRGVIPKSLQLIASRTAQDYNLRKNRKGAYWEGRYHATAIEQDEHLFNCLAYIDLNMVRAGVVSHPSEWKHSGYHEIQTPRKRYSIIDIKALMETGGFSNYATLKEAHTAVICRGLHTTMKTRQAFWSESIAVGSDRYIEQIKQAFGLYISSRKKQEVNGVFVLKEPSAFYQIEERGFRILCDRSILSRISV